MSLLTGEPRTATVLARGEPWSSRSTPSCFGASRRRSPQAIEQVGVAAAARRSGARKVRAAAPGPAVADAPASFLEPDASVSADYPSQS